MIKIGNGAADFPVDQLFCQILKHLTTKEFFSRTGDRTPYLLHVKPACCRYTTAASYQKSQKFGVLNDWKSLPVTTFFVGNKQSHFLPYLSVYNFNWIPLNQQWVNFTKFFCEPIWKWLENLIQLFDIKITVRKLRNLEKSF